MCRWRAVDLACLLLRGSSLVGIQYVSAAHQIGPLGRREGCLGKLLEEHSDHHIDQDQRNLAERKGNKCQH